EPGNPPRELYVRRGGRRKLPHLQHRDRRPTALSAQGITRDARPDVRPPAQFREARAHGTASAVASTYAAPEAKRARRSVSAFGSSPSNGSPSAKVSW